MPEVAFALVSGSLFRLLSGGAHCNAYWRCLSLGLLIYLGASELGLYLVRYLTTDFLVYSLLAGCLLSSICVIAWAPGEVPFKRITKTSERILFKVLSLAYLSLWLGTTMLFISHPTLIIAGLIAILIQTISFSPPGYKAIHKLDSLLAGLIKERRCPANAEDN